MAFTITFQSNPLVPCKLGEVMVNAIFTKNFNLCGCFLSLKPFKGRGWGWGL